MQVRAKRRRLGAQARREMVARFNSSGVSAEVFSQRERVSLASLKRWQQELEGKQAPAAVSGGFLELGSLRSGGARFEVRLELGDGVLLTLSHRLTYSKPRVELFFKWIEEQLQRYGLLPNDPMAKDPRKNNFPFQLGLIV